MSSATPAANEPSAPGQLPSQLEAVEMLDAELSFVSERLKSIKLTATTEQKQYANRVFVELRDYRTRLKLVGQPAPEIEVKEWISGEPATLAALRGKVILLEFWATWCKPCEQMFPKLKQLADEYGARGLNIIALTRHYLTMAIIDRAGVVRHFYDGDEERVRQILDSCLAESV